MGLPLVHVLGDVAWLHFYQVCELPSDSPSEELTADRRVRKSKTLKLAGGAWLTADFIRHAVGDVGRLPLTVPIDLRHHTIKVEAHQSPIAFYIDADDQNLSLRLRSLHIALDGNDDLRIRAEVDSDAMRRYIDLLPNDAKLGFLFAAPGPDQINPWADDWFDVEVADASGSSPQASERIWLIAPSLDEDSACRVLVPSRSVVRISTDSIELKRNGKIFLPGPWTLAPLNDASSVGGTLELALPGLTRVFSFDRVIDLQFLRGAVRFRRSFTVPTDEQLTPTIKRWQRNFAKPPDPLAYVDTFSQSTGAAQPVRAWWEVGPDGSRQPKAATRARAPRLRRIFGYEPGEPVVQESHPHATLWPESTYPSLVDKPSAYLVLLDLNFGFRQSPQENDGTEDWREPLEHWKSAPPDDRGLILVGIGRQLPTVMEIEEGPGLWNAIWKDPEMLSHTVIVVSAQLLRASGIRISHRLSWEHAAEDCLLALQKHPKMRMLAKVGRLIVRFGCVGAIYIENKAKGPPGERMLLFDALAKDGFHRDPESEGIVLGNNSAVIACVLRNILETEKRLRSTNGRRRLTSAQTNGAIRRGLRAAILVMQKLYDEGYNVFQGVGNTDILDYRAPGVLCDTLQALSDKVSARAAHRTHAISCVAIPANKGWSIVGAHSEEEMLAAAKRYVRDRGIGNNKLRVENQELAKMMIGGAYVPLARFGQFIAIAREEIESYRSIQAILRRYILVPEDKPISIAVFGPPGSGKSFGVRQVAESIKKDYIQAWEFNLAQFSSPNDLVIPLLKARDVQGQKVPLIVFDEFDSNLGDVPLGWLRYFLQPMQDGSFKHNEDVRRIGRAILVFAGGTSESFSEFSREEHRSEAVKDEFKRAKGPDFVSRLSGFIDTYGINPIRQDKAADPGYVLRRAILLRSLLERRKLMGSTDRALVDTRMLRCLLTLEKYKHGARSMELLLKMCVGEQGQVRLPSTDQLKLHVTVRDADLLWSNVGTR